MSRCIFRVGLRWVQGKVQVVSEDFKIKVMPLRKAWGQDEATWDSGKGQCVEEEQINHQSSMKAGEWPREDGDKIGT